MAVNPYDRPNNFTYRPFNYAPLMEAASRSQQALDQLSLQAEAMGLEFNHLNLEGDKELADKVRSEFNEQKEGLVSNLYKTKDFRQAARDLVKMQSEWEARKKDAGSDLYALESRYSEHQQNLEDLKEMYLKTGDPIYERRYKDYANKVQQSSIYGEDGVYNSSVPGYVTGKWSDVGKIAMDYASKIKADGISVSGGTLQSDPSTGGLFLRSTNGKITQLTPQEAKSILEPIIYSNAEVVSYMQAEEQLGGDSMTIVDNILNGVANAVAFRDEDISYSFKQNPLAVSRAQKAQEAKMAMANSQGLTEQVTDPVLEKYGIDISDTDIKSGEKLANAYEEIKTTLHKKQTELQRYLTAEEAEKKGIILITEGQFPKALDANQKNERRILENEIKALEDNITYLDNRYDVGNLTTAIDQEIDKLDRRIAQSKETIREQKKIMDNTSQMGPKWDLALQYWRSGKERLAYYTRQKERILNTTYASVGNAIKKDGLTTQQTAYYVTPDVEKNNPYFRQAKQTMFANPAQFTVTKTGEDISGTPADLAEIFNDERAQVSFYEHGGRWKAQVVVEPRTKNFHGTEMDDGKSGTYHIDLGNHAVEQLVSQGIAYGNPEAGSAGAVDIQEVNNARLAEFSSRLRTSATSSLSGGSPVNLSNRIQVNLGTGASIPVDYTVTEKTSGMGTEVSRDNKILVFRAEVPDVTTGGTKVIEESVPAYQIAASPTAFLTKGFNADGQETQGFHEMIRIIMLQDTMKANAMLNSQQ